MGIYRKVSFVSLVCLLFLSLTAVTQNPKIDSLKSVVETGTKDTLMVSTMNTLAYELMRQGDMAQSFSVFEQAADLASQLSYKNGEAMMQSVKLRSHVGKDGILKVGDPA